MARGDLLLLSFYAKVIFSPVSRVQGYVRINQKLQTTVGFFYHSVKSCHRVAFAHLYRKVNLHKSHFSAASSSSSSFFFFPLILTSWYKLHSSSSSGAKKCHRRTGKPRRRSSSLIPAAAAAAVHGSTSSS